MKKIAIVLFILAFAFSGYAVEWRGTNQATIAWDAVTLNVNGDPIPANHTIKYRVYLANAVTDPDKDNPVLLDEIAGTSYTLTLNAEGKFIVGVESVRYNELNELIGVSPTINWSDVNGVHTPNPFGFEHYLPPATPEGLK